MAIILKKWIKKALTELVHLNEEELVELRIEKFSRMGSYDISTKETLVAK